MDATTHSSAARLLRAGLLTALVDGLFASGLAVAYGGTVTRLWQGVASTLLGPGAYQGGSGAAAIGLLMHVGVAFGWSAVFLARYQQSPRLRALVASPGGAVGVAAVYGPAIWLVMSLLVIPLLVRRAPTLALRWVINLVAHVPFVACPIIFSVREQAPPAVRSNRPPGWTARQGDPA